MCGDIRFARGGLWPDRGYGSEMGRLESGTKAAGGRITSEPRHVTGIA